MATTPRTSPHVLAAMRREVLLASPVFAQLRPTEMDELLANALERKFSRGTQIFSKGDPGSFMLAVLSGLVRVGATSAEGREITLNVIGPGEIVGEIALLDGKPRSANATAVEETSLRVIPVDKLKDKLAKADPFINGLLHILAKNLRVSQR